MEAGADAEHARRARGVWLGASLAAALATHAVALGNGLLDADRLLLVHNPDARSFAGLARMLADGVPVLRAGALSLRDGAPLGVLSTWLGWQWFRGSPVAQHALGLASLLAAVVVLSSLLRALRVEPALAGIATLALALHPSTADVTGPILGRSALLATCAALYAARRAREASAASSGVRGTLRSVSWVTGGALVAGLLAPGWGLLGLVAAAAIADPKARRIASCVVVAVAAAAVVMSRAELHLGGVGPGGAAVLLAWLPSPRPFVIASVDSDASPAVVVVVVLAAFALIAASRAADEDDAALFRAGGAAMIASSFAGAATWREGTSAPGPALALQLGVIFALTAVAQGHSGALAARARPWMLAAFAVPAAVTAWRARGWADEGRLLETIATRGPDDREASLARARIALRRGDLDGASPWCDRYAAAAPKTFRADGCIAAVEVARGNDEAAVLLLKRWASRFDDKRALRSAILEIADAQPSPAFGVAFQRATGFALPVRRPGELR